MKCKIGYNVVWFDGYAVADLRLTEVPATVADNFTHALEDLNELDGDSVEALRECIGGQNEEIEANETEIQKYEEKLDALETLVAELQEKLANLGGD